MRRSYSSSFRELAGGLSLLIGIVTSLAPAEIRVRITFGWTRCSVLRFCYPKQAPMNTKSSPKAPSSTPAAESSGTFRKALAVATRVGLHPKTIHRWAAKGLIHRYKINDRVVLFDEAEVQRFINRARVTANGGRTT
jgi:hypothetical protein